MPPLIRSGKAEQVNIGIMGGTFDPIHIGHLVSAEGARQQFALDCVVFVPAGLPPHKEMSKVSAPEHRYLMTTLAVMSNPAFFVSRYEVDRVEPSYTIDTVRHFSRQQASGVNLYFITGVDAIIDILTWKDYAELLALCSFIAVTRLGYSLKRLEEAQKKMPGIMNRVHLLEIPALAISSTYIRERVAAGKTIRYLTPEPVEQYIEKQRLYTAG